LERDLERDMTTPIGCLSICRLRYGNGSKLGARILNKF
jgi:hypothetical protein